MFCTPHSGILLLLLLLALPAQAITLATWNTKHLGWGEKRDWETTAHVIAPYDWVALQEVMYARSVKRLEQKVERVTGAEWSSIGSDVAVGRGRYKEIYAFVWREDAVDYTGGAAVYGRYTATSDVGLRSVRPSS